MSASTGAITEAGIRCPFCGGIFRFTAAKGVESHSEPACPEFTEYHPKGTFMDRAGVKAGWKRGPCLSD